MSRTDAVTRILFEAFGAAEVRLFYLLGYAAIAIFCYGVYVQIRKYRRGAAVKLEGGFWTRLGAMVSSVLNGRTVISEAFAMFPNLSTGGDFRFTLDISAATKLKNWLSWQVTFSDRFTNYPQPGLVDNDTILSTGLRLTFGKGKF